MVQEYLPSVEQEGEISLVFFDQELSHAVQKIPRRGDFRVQEKHGGFTKLIRPTPAAVELAQRVLASLSLPPLYARVDLIRNPETQQWALIELEVIEPQLFLDYDADSARRLAQVIARKVSNNK